MKSRHEYFMNLAMNMALKARGNTSPNPLVGAVVVKNKKIISSGFHKQAGLAHAEIEAFKNCRTSLNGSTLYVTLEPCCVFGRTPPCTDAIINYGIKKVIIGMVDPNPKNNGKGIRILRRNRIKVEAGFLEDKLKKINESYIKYISKNIPFVTVKVGQSLDGKIATKGYQSKWITSDASRNYSHKLRRDFDAIMIGINTLIRDNPGLEAKSKKRKIFKIIIDPQLKIPLKSNVLRHGSGCVIVATSFKADRNKEKKLQGLGAIVLRLNGPGNRLDLKSLLKKLGKMGIANILVEGGGTLIGSLFDRRLVDKILFFVAPKIIGGRLAISSVMGQGASSLNKAVELKDVSVSKIGRDYLFEAYVDN